MNESIGWHAIDNALLDLYPKIQPVHFANDVPYELGGELPLEGISVYYNNEYYHYITYGLTELHKKESENKEYSGWGFELTFKLKVTETKNEIPKWPIELLQNIAKVVYERELVLQAFHTLSNPPKPTDSDSELDGILLVKDTELPDLNTEFGKVEFLQLFGLTADEYFDIIDKIIDRREFIQQEKLVNPFLVTDLNRI